MRTPFLTLIVAFTVLTLAARLGYGIVIADMIPSSGGLTLPTPGPTKEPLNSGPAPPSCAPGKGPTKDAPCNPEAGLSDPEREALHQRLWNEFVTRYTVWLNSLDIGKLDLHSLPRGELSALYVPGQPSLREAVARADLIVVGRVLAIRPTPFSGMVTTFSVDGALKGPAAPTVVFTQTGGLEPTQDWSGIVIAEGGNGAMLLPGDRAVLLLEWTSLGYEIQSSSGWYQVVNGVVQPNSLNTWGASIDGIAEAAFLQQLQAALQ